jgi:hypothetical protein
MFGLFNVVVSDVIQSFDMSADSLAEDSAHAPVKSGRLITQQFSLWLRCVEGTLRKVECYDCKILH